MRTYTVTNHNGTILGVFLNIKAAYREQLEYRAQTGNMAYIDDTETGQSEAQPETERIKLTTAESGGYSHSEFTEEVQHGGRL